ncbi:porin [Aquabacterium sp. G14]|uniref:porin n=1 Tax=Aquabacterium sp. G14 TaxID=3130164 RepID=UPI0030B372BA
MKTRIGALVIGAFAAQGAMAQSNVSIFGTLDLSVRTIKNEGASMFTSVGAQGNMANRIGFKGEEDLGGNMKATFHLEAGILPDTGESMGQAYGIGFWNRQSTVGLKGNFGEVKLGRDWTASYLSMSIYDPSFGFGVADTLHVSRNTLQPTYFWANNAISYTLPSNLGGVYGQLMYAPGESTVNGKYTGGRFGYGAGPYDVSVSFGSQDVLGGSFKVFSIGGAYDMGVVKLTALYNREKVVDAKETRVVLGVTVPIGSNYAFVSFAKSSVSDFPGAHGASQIGGGYVHTLSKRTAVYANAAWLTNKGDGQLSTTNFGSFGSTAPVPGGKSQGFEIGVRHNF